MAYAEQMREILKIVHTTFNTLHVNLCCHLVQCTTCCGNMLWKHNDVLQYPDLSENMTTERDGHDKCQDSTVRRLHVHVHAKA